QGAVEDAGVEAAGVALRVGRQRDARAGQGHVAADGAADGGRRGVAGVLGLDVGGDRAGVGDVHREERAQRRVELRQVLGEVEVGQRAGVSDRVGFGVRAGVDAAVGGELVVTVGVGDGRADSGAAAVVQLDVAVGVGGLAGGRLVEAVV